MEKKYDLVLETAYKLFSEKGYFFVSTKEIAETAGISEMTIFRNFKTKQNLFSKVLDNYVFTPNLKNLFENEFSWDLKKDLPVLFRVFYDLMEQHYMLIFVKLTEPPHKFDKDHEGPKLMEKIRDELIANAIKYFSEMKKKGLIKDDPFALSINFCSGIFGIFFSNKIARFYSDEIELNRISKNFIDVYTRGIR